MRVLVFASMLGWLMALHPAAAQDRKLPPANPEASPAKALTAQQESEAQTAERKKAEELAKARQRRMDRLSRSICSGC
jgi:hypothetical protein